MFLEKTQLDMSTGDSKKVIAPESLHPTSSGLESWSNKVCDNLDRFLARMITIPSDVASEEFITMGLLAEMNMRVYHEAQNKPTYVIKDIIQ